MLAHQFVKRLQVKVVFLHEKVEHILEGATKITVQILPEIGLGISFARQEREVFKSLAVCLVVYKALGFHDLEHRGDCALGRSRLGKGINDVLEKGLFQLPKPLHQFFFSAGELLHFSFCFRQMYSKNLELRLSMQKYFGAFRNINNLPPQGWCKAMIVQALAMASQSVSIT